MFRFSLLIACLAFLVTSISGQLLSRIYRADSNLARLLKQPADYSDLGSALSSSPNCLSRDDHQAHCFFATKKGTVGYASVVEGRADFEDFGGNVIDQPQTAAYGSEGVFAIFITPKKKIAVLAVETGTPFDKNVTILDFGKSLEAPGCVMMEDDHKIFCAVRAKNGGMHTFKLENGVWGSYSRIADNPSGPVSCVTNPKSNRIQCWANREDGRLAERLFMANGDPDSCIWAGVGLKGRGRVSVHLPAVTMQPRSLALMGEHMIDMFGRFGGSLRSEPDCINADSRTLDCFALDEQYGLQRNHQMAGFLFVRRTSGWVSYGGDFVGKPSCIFMSSDSKFHCYMRTTENTLMEGLFEPLYRHTAFFAT